MTDVSKASERVWLDAVYAGHPDYYITATNEGDHLSIEYIRADLYEVLQARVTELEGVSNQNTQPKGYFCQFSVSYNKDAEKMYASNPAEDWIVHDSSHEMSFVDEHGTPTKIASFKHAHEASAVEARLNELINATALWKSKCINSPQENK